MWNALPFAVTGLILVNLWTMLRFWQDKQRAKAGEPNSGSRPVSARLDWRGSPCALLARRIFRHKTRKEPLSTMLFVIIVLQIGAVIGLTIA
ncbi:DUF1294 domain-containing protein [Sphingomonas edaphi]|uniref:DUF1294 domain-containing protein n=2 Tax=Sphingomonas edaphi TaxID=2315689 RepID=A0A418Q3Y0_9SPHN|nr:DUF1294 domain-containing protein [Sphingomonas edaphi]